MLKVIKELKTNTKIYLLIIVTLFFTTYFPHTLIMNENISTIEAFEVDASLMVDSVFQHLQTYNLQVGYMSKFYGWSYFFINYLILKPINLLQNIFFINDPSYNIFLVKVVYFLISLSSCIVLFFLLKKIFKKDIVAFIGTLLYIFPPLKTEFFTDIKPETTGLLFLFLSQIFLIKFIESKKEKMLFWYLLGITSLTLSALAKQSFIFLIPPTILSYYLYYVQKNQLNFWRNIFTKKTFLVILFSLFVVAVITFIVYPHLFRHPDNFINAQKLLLNDHSGNGPLVLKGIELFKAWKNAIWNNQFLKMIIFSYPIAIIISLLNKKLILRKFFIVNFLLLPILIFIVCKNSGLFVVPNYIAPFLSLFLIILLLPFSIVLNIKHIFIKYILIIFYAFLFLTFILTQLFSTHTYLENRKNYKQSDVYQVYNYISKEIPKGSKLAVSQDVLVPKNEDGSIAYPVCTWWQNCGLKPHLDDFKPDYLIFINNTIHNGIQPKYYLNYTDYIKDHHFQLQTTIEKFVIYKR